MRKKILGIMVVGRGEADRWLKPVLDQRKELADDMIIAGNNTDRKTEKLIKSYGFWFYRDDREWGIYQPQIKNDLLEKAAKLKPDWILPSDADELYDRLFTREEAEKLMEKPAIAYYFAIINLWNNENHYRHDLSFWNIRFFQLRPDLGMRFQNKRLHCGLAPPVCYRYGWHAPFLVKHYGLLKPEDRAEKVKRYEKYDPNAVFKGREYYDKLKDDRCLNYFCIYPFDEEKMHQKIAAEVKKYDEHKKQPRTAG